jgi:hypothetical protein
MKIAKHLLVLAALAVVPAAVAASVPSPEAMERLQLRESVASRIQARWKMDLELSAMLVPQHRPRVSLNFREEPLVVQLALTNDARMASLPIFSGGIVEADGALRPYLLIDRGGPFELMIFHSSESSSFGWAEVYAVHLLATDQGPLLLLGGDGPRNAEVAYRQSEVARAR